MTVVLDASALLALGTVNLAEVATVLVHNDRDPALLGTVRGQVRLEPFSTADAIAVANLYPRVATRGLSLGDRACLALADRLTAPALTAERIWADLTLDAEIQYIRPEETGSRR